MKKKIPPCLTFLASAAHQAHRFPGLPSLSPGNGRAAVGQASLTETSLL